MNRRIRAAALALILVPTGTAAAAATNATQPDDSSATSAIERAGIKRGAALTSAARQVDEGSRYTLTATIKSPRRARKVTLQKFNPPNYSFQEPAWDTVRAAKVKARRKVKFTAVAVEHNSEKYRVTVTYKKARPVTSKPATVFVWRWIPLKEYTPYYVSEPYGTAFGTTTINGHAYAGWGAAYYSHTGTWESRFTSGRHCNAFRGVLGVDDGSADGSSGTVEFTADDATVYSSPTLTPGMDLPVTVPLPTKPYRFGIRLSDTTPGGTTGRDDIEAFPGIGEPVLRCTGV
ncbi:hypothetical protein [Nocardioides dongkuii]|uniref:hypothetical protein n=1 Tax=Nocardioides dongkuii TaxID=2760089 RepID=UPI0015FA425D|nr:hypothetical protein [Nocardioides dongkuii]